MVTDSCDLENICIRLFLIMTENRKKMSRTYDTWKTKSIDRNSSDLSSPVTIAWIISRVTRVARWNLGQQEWVFRIAAVRVPTFIIRESRAGTNEFFIIRVGAGPIPTDRGISSRRLSIRGYLLLHRLLLLLSSLGIVREMRRYAGRKRFSCAKEGNRGALALSFPPPLPPPSCSVNQF